MEIPTYVSPSEHGTTGTSGTPVGEVNDDEASHPQRRGAGLKVWRRNPTTTHHKGVEPDWSGRQC